MRRLPDSYTVTLPVAPRDTLTHLVTAYPEVCGPETVLTYIPLTYLRG